ncbi:MAG: PLP-dependent aminotransferase family protein [Myxococcota bacterium]|nr:PLP-dependent aminotransferase family protein [Myxococcota bacterium]
MGTRARAVLTLEEGSGPIFLRIARQVADDIRRGRLRSGDALPGTRLLAESLGINRNTVVSAYSELVAEGWAIARPGGGTYVADSIPEPRFRASTRALRPEFVVRPPHFAMTACGPPALAAPYPHGTLVMAGGVPDTRLLPVDLFARALRRVLTARGARDALGYGDARGDARLRAAVADLVRETRGVPARPEDVLVVRGSQMALALVARALVPRGGAIAVEAIGYPSAWAAFASVGARLVPVPVDARGLDVDALASIIRSHRIHAVYVTPHHQYPTTVTLAPGRRSALLDLARRERFAIIEDDYDHELHYEGRPVLPLASADIHGSVVYVGSLSKVLAPGLRLGYVVASTPVIERLARERFVIDRQGDHAGERAAAELIEDGTLLRHVRRMRRVYLTRRDRLVDLLQSTFGDRVEVKPPPGGMALWVRVRLAPSKIVVWEKRALEHGVAFVAGERLTFDGRPIPFARIGFAPLDEDEVREAVTRLARAF